MIHKAFREASSISGAHELPKARGAPLDSPPPPPPLKIDSSYIHVDERMSYQRQRRNIQLPGPGTTEGARIQLVIVDVLPPSPLLSN